MIKAVPVGNTPMMFGDKFNEIVLDEIREKLPLSHPMFKSLNVIYEYNNKTLEFSFTRKINKKMTQKQIEAIGERFSPILKAAISVAREKTGK